MKTGKKIKTFRESRGLSQKQLADLSNISIDNISKYENGKRNPKFEQLQKIACGLNISINVLFEFSMTSINEIAPFLFALAKSKGIEFEGEKNLDGKYQTGTVSIKFKDDTLQMFLKDWADKKEVIDKLRAEANNSPDENVKVYMLERADEIEKEIKLHLANSSGQ